MNLSIDEITPMHPETRPSRKTLAFTLVEMLVVAAVIILMLGITLPLFKGMLEGRGVEKSINSVTGVIELARTTAIANQTFVWVLFRNVTNSDNNAELRCAAVMSLNGMNYYQPTNFKAITGLIKIPNIKNLQFNDLPQALKNIAPSDVSNGSFIAGWYPTNNSNFPSFTVAGQDFGGSPFFYLNADGEIATSGDTYDMLFEPKICLGLVGTHGTTVPANAHDGAIITVYGGSARMRVSRP